MRDFILKATPNTTVIHYRHGMVANLSCKASKPMNIKVIFSNSTLGKRGTTCDLIQGPWQTTCIVCVMSLTHLEKMAISA